MDLDPIVQSAIVAAIAAITTAWIANRRKDPVKEVQTEVRVESTRQALQRADDYMEKLEAENLRLRRLVGSQRAEDI